MPGTAGKRSAVAKQVKCTLCPRYGDTQTIHGRQKSDVELFVASHERNDNDVVFLSLDRRMRANVRLITVTVTTITMIIITITITRNTIFAVTREARLKGI